MIHSWLMNYNQFSFEVPLHPFCKSNFFPAFFPVFQKKKFLCKCYLYTWKFKVTFTFTQMFLFYWTDSLIWSFFFNNLIAMQDSIEKMIKKKKIILTGCTLQYKILLFLCVLQIKLQIKTKIHEIYKISKNN